MAEHNVLGKQGEEAAARYIVMHDYIIKERDWHLGHRDIDIIAEKHGILVFVEVKTRSSEYFGTPEDSVDDDKKRNLLEAANCYVRLNSIDMAVRFDIVSVIKEGNFYRIRHFPNAFDATDWKAKHDKYRRF